MLKKSLLIVLHLRRNLSRNGEESMFYEKIKSNWIEILIYLGGYKEKSPCMQGEISILWVDTTRWKREILVYDKKSCVITARSCCRYRKWCCRYSQFKGILFMKREILLHMEKKSLWIEKNSSILREKFSS